VHSFLLKATSDYVQSFISFQFAQKMDGHFEQIDLSGVIEEKHLGAFVQLMYDSGVCHSWKLNFVIEMLQVVDVLCCESLIEHLAREIVGRLTVSNLPKIIFEWHKRFGHIDLLFRCCKELLQCSKKNVAGYDVAFKTFSHFTKERPSL
jgi:hypothetical protein